MFFDLGLNSLLDTSHEDADGNLIQGYYMPGAFEYLTALKAAGHRLGLLIDVPEEWGNSNDAKLAATKQYIEKGWIAKDAAHPRSMDWTMFDPSAVQFPRTDVDRKKNNSLYLFKKALELAGPCKAVHQATREVEVALSKSAGLPAYQIGAPGKPYYLPESQIAALANSIGPIKPDGNDFAAKLATEDDFFKLMAFDGNVKAHIIKFTIDHKTPGEPLYLQNMKKYQGHADFLRGYIDRFKNGSFSMDDIIYGPAKELTGGNLYYSKVLKVPGAAAPGLVGFDIYVDPKNPPNDPFSPTDLKEVKDTHDKIQAALGFMGDRLVFVFPDALFFKYFTKLKAVGVLSIRGSQLQGHEGYEGN